MDDLTAEAGQFAARQHLAWLIWCYDQGYGNPADRAILSNWMLGDPGRMHPDDVRTREHLLRMADEMLATLAQERPRA